MGDTKIEWAEKTGWKRVGPGAWMNGGKHWSALLVDFLTELSHESGCSLVGADEGDLAGDRTPAQINIGYLPGRWWVIIEESDSEPVIAMTDGTVEGSRMIWFHDDGQPFRDALITAMNRWRQRENQVPEGKE